MLKNKTLLRYHLNSTCYIAELLKEAKLTGQPGLLRFAGVRSGKAGKSVATLMREECRREMSK